MRRGCVRWMIMILWRQDDGADSGCGMLSGSRYQDRSCVVRAACSCRFRSPQCSAGPLQRAVPQIRRVGHDHEFEVMSHVSHVSEAKRAYSLSVTLLTGLHRLVLAYAPEQAKQRGGEARSAPARRPTPRRPSKKSLAARIRTLRGATRLLLGKCRERVLTSEVLCVLE